MKIWKILLRAKISPPPTSDIQIVVSEVQSQLRYQVHPFLALLLNLGHFGHFVPDSTSFIQHFLGYKIVASMRKYDAVY